MVPANIVGLREIFDREGVAVTGWLSEREAVISLPPKCFQKKAHHSPASPGHRNKNSVS